MEQLPLFMCAALLLLIPFGVYQDWIKPKPARRSR